jgi:hypothetical protein
MNDPARPTPGSAPEPAPGQAASAAGESQTERFPAVEIDAAPAAALAAVAEAAEGWGAEWRAEGDRGGRLSLPALAGIRRGWISGRVRVEPLAADRSRVVFERQDEDLRLHVPSVAILVLAAAGGMLTVLWPFYPALLPVAPRGAGIALGGWLLVVSKLRTAGPEELLGLAAELGGDPPPGDALRPR